MSNWIFKIILNSLNILFILESFLLLLDHSLIPTLIVFGRVQSSSVSKLENFLLDIWSLVIFRVACVILLKIEFVEVVLVISENLLFVQKLFKSFIFPIVLQISLEIVSISLVLLCKIIWKDSVSIIPSLISPLKHSLLSSDMIYRIHIFSWVEFCQFSKLSIQFPDNPLSMDQVLISKFAERLSPRRINQLFFFVVFHSKNVDFCFHLGFCFSVNSVCRISKYTIMLIRADQRVDSILGSIINSWLKMSVCLLKG